MNYEEIGSLVYLLEIIVCSTDKLLELCETLGNLKSLTKFDSSSSQIPHFIGRLMDLVHLCLLACPYKLSNSVGELESLVQLDLAQFYWKSD